MNKVILILKILYVFLLSIVFLCCSGGSPSSRNSYERKSSANKYSSKKKEIQHSNSVTKKIVSTDKKHHSLKELYNNYKKSVFVIYTSDGYKTSQGSGFFISKDGLAISNYHVFKGTLKGLELIKTLDGKEFKIKEVIEKSEDLDYIIFRVNIGNSFVKNPLPIASKLPEIGDDVFAIGNPRGLESTLSKGIISSYRENYKLIQTTTEITHGSSGGPLLNMRGEVVGITTAGFGEANLNFAINIKFVNVVISNPSRITERNFKSFMPVTKVVDGDTFWVDDGTNKGLKIRLIGVDTPETVHPNKPIEFYGIEASNYVKKLLEGKDVRLEFDIDKTDRYGRTLAYVYLRDGTFLNANIIKNGYGYASTVPPNVKFSKKFRQLEREARIGKVGLWKN